jgi:hypothetical protein
VIVAIVTHPCTKWHHYSSNGVIGPRRPLTKLVLFAQGKKGGGAGANKNPIQDGAKKARSGTHMTKYRVPPGRIVKVPYASCTLIPLTNHFAVGRLIPQFLTDFAKFGLSSP